MRVKHFDNFFRTSLPIIPSEAFGSTFAFKLSGPLLQCEVISSHTCLAAIVALTFLFFGLVISCHISLFKLILKYNKKRDAILDIPQLFFNLFPQPQI